MSEKFSFQNGTPVAAYEDIVDFFRKRTTSVCPVCGFSGWNILATNQVNDTNVAMGIVMLDVETGVPLAQAASYVLAHCKKCAFMRMHHLLTISNWVKEGKPDFVEDENS